MQTLSHGTRAYIVNADGLPGFVKNFDFMNFDIIQFLQAAEKADKLEHAKKWQVIFLSEVS